MLTKFIGWNCRAAEALALRWPSAFGVPQPGYLNEMKDIIAKVVAAEHPYKILEAGGVDRPMIERSADYTFIGVDIEERPECSSLYDEFVVQSIEEPLEHQVDMVISFTLMEHVPNNIRAVKSMFESLRRGGTTHHYIPSRLHPYSLALRIVGPRMQKMLIPHLRPGAEKVTGYPTFFHCCTPAAMEALFREQGFVDIAIQPYYRANDYFAFFLPAFVAVSMLENACRALGIRSLASGFLISARKPGAA